MLCSSSSAINNFFNLLVNLNAASNFILYCALSDKYRKTVKAIFCGMKPMRKNTLSSSRFTSGRTTTSSFYSRSHKSSFFDRQRFRPKQPKRFSISKEEYENLKAETEMLKRPQRFNPSATTTSEQSRTNSISTVSYSCAFRPPLRWAALILISMHWTVDLFRLTQDETAVTEVINEGIPLHSFPPQQQKARKNRLKNIRLSFAPPNNNQSVCAPTSLPHRGPN